MNEFKLKSNEMMFFLDFNKTIVDYTNEYDMPNRYFEIKGYTNPYHTRTVLAKALVEFEEKCHFVENNQLLREKLIDLKTKLTDDQSTELIDKIISNL